MNKNHQDKIESKLTATEDKLWLPPLSLKDQEKPHLQKARKKAKQTLIIIGISAAFVGVIVLIYIWFSFHWPRWVLISLILGGVLIGMMLLILLIRVGFTAQWPGFKGKTLWDWLNLLGTLAIPLVVVGATIGFGWWQGQLADEQHTLDAQRAQDQQHATILQTYIDNVQDLLLNHNLLGDSPKPKSDTDKVTIQEVRELARARTLTALQGLDPSRKSRLVQFLYEAHLIGFLDSKKKQQPPIVDLAGADLSCTFDLNGEKDCVNLSGADLSGANLSGADLSGANLSDAHLESADLSLATLRNADLSLATLSNATLSSAHLDSADLSNAYLDSADLSGATLEKANLSFTYLSDAHLDNVRLDSANLNVTRLNGATLNWASLEDTYLVSADLSSATLIGADLSRANLSDAHLNGTDLSGAYLKGATLSGDNLSNDNLIDATLIGDDLSAVSLSGADLRGADLSGTNLNGTDLGGGADKTTLEGARYNTKEILIRNLQGNILETIPLTIWPQGFNPKIAGVTEDNTTQDILCKTPYRLLCNDVR